MIQNMCELKSEMILIGKSTQEIENNLSEFTDKTQAFLNLSQKQSYHYVDYVQELQRLTQSAKDYQGERFQMFVRDGQGLERLMQVMIQPQTRDLTSPSVDPATINLNQTLREIIEQVSKMPWDDLAASIDALILQLL